MTNSKRRRLERAAAKRQSVWAHDPSAGSPERGNRRTRRNRQFGRDRIVAQRGTLDEVAAQQAAVNGPEAAALIADAALATTVFSDDELEQAQRDAAVAVALKSRPRKTAKA